ncbi:alpha/beta fold hydrolase [Pseudidiomarina sediminum]|uniref:alpha/beta fold hydrolase n=1 Tax=Pseudidiomarina sediminum TaxID=431675 RepID=UPI001C988D6B|nr:alpha/beta hydrolase [Pseudidiomarina sediminum]MBY6063361.1 alpha/beta hydrolase [Pseudidiomarina sediminum]
MTQALPQGVHRFGNPEGAKLVLLHSSQSNTGQWRALIQALQNDFDCIGVDLLGYGSAPKADLAKGEAFRFEDELTRVVEGVKGLIGTQPIALVGHSYGGALALKIAFEQHLDVRALAMFEPVAFHLLEADEPARVEIEAIAAQMHQHDALAATTAFVDYWNFPGFFAGLPAKMQQLMASQASKVALDFAALMGEPHAPSAYQHMNLPVLLLTGSHTQQSAKRVAEQLLQVLPKVDHQQLDCGHMGPLTHPQLVNPLLIAFLHQHKDALRV